MLSIELAVTATLALGMLLVLLPGMIDLSVGSGVGLIGGIASVLVFEHQIPAPLAMGVGFAFAILVWSLMGKLIVRQRIPAFIITLGGLLVFKGAFWLVIHNSTIPVSEGNATNIYALLTTYFLPVSGGYLLLVVIGALFVCLGSGSCPPSAPRTRLCRRRFRSRFPQGFRRAAGAVALRDRNEWFSAASRSRWLS